MKSIYLSLVLLFISISLFAQTVKKPIIVKRTAEWCTFCGTWGWDFMEDLETQFPNNQAVILGVHHSGDLANPTSIAFINNFAGQAQPIFYLNNNSLGVNQTTAADRLIQAAQETFAINQEPPLFEISIDAAKASDYPAVEVSVDVSANDDTTVPYYVGTYLIHDDLLYTQTSQTGVVEHSKVLIASFDDQVFGRPSFDIASDPEVTLNYAYTDEDVLGEYKAKTLDVAVIIWTKENDTYIVEQAEVIENIGIISNTNELVLIDESSIYIDESDVLNFNAQLTGLVNDIQLSILDLTGKLIHSEKINLNAESISYRFDTAALTTGQYVLSIQTDRGIHSESFIK